MAMAQAAHRARPGRVKVGERVGVSVGGRVLSAQVIEDRGDLGAHGQQVVRLAVGDPMIPWEHFEVEVPVDWLQPAPPARRASRR
jgi:hypothetical protein